MEYGIQLYTLRNQCKTELDIQNTFVELKKIGITLAQVSGLGEIAPQRLRKIADDNSIHISCTHTDYNQIITNTEAVAVNHLTLGADTVGIGCMPHKYSVNNYKELNQFLDETANALEKLKKFNLNLAYHNHAAEFQKKDGVKVLDILADKTKMDFILDTYWVYFAKESIEDYIQKLRGRLLNIHLKDYKKILGLVPIMCELGRGKIPFDKLMPEFAKAGTKFALIEQDISKNPLQSVQISWDYVSKTLKK